MARLNYGTAVKYRSTCVTRCWLVGRSKELWAEAPPDVKVVPIHECGAVEEPDAPENAGPGAVLSVSVPCDGHG